MQPTRLLGRGGAAIFKPASPLGMSDATIARAVFISRTVAFMLVAISNSDKWLLASLITLESASCLHRY